MPTYSSIPIARQPRPQPFDDLSTRQCPHLAQIYIFCRQPERKGLSHYYTG
jgi:hypothetical protein